MAVMREQGIVEGSGGVNEVNEQVAARMRVLAAPDIEVVALLSRGKLLYGIVDDENQPPVPAISRQRVPSGFGPPQPALGISGSGGNDITVDDVAIADSASIAALVIDGLESIHHAEPAAINAVNVPMEDMLEATKSWQESDFNVFSGGDLRRMGISAATVAALGQALSDPAAEVAVYARQYRDDAKGPSASVLSLKDGSGGRIALYQQARTAGSGEAWLASARRPPNWSRWA